MWLPVASITTDDESRPIPLPFTFRGILANFSNVTKTVDLIGERRYVEVCPLVMAWNRSLWEWGVLMRFSLLSLSLATFVFAVPGNALAQAVEFGSAAELAAREAYRDRLREGERLYTNAKVLFEEELWLTPTEEDVTKVIAMREAERPTAIALLKGEITTLKKRKAATRDRSERADIDNDLAARTSTLRLLETKNPASAALLRPHLPMDAIEVGALGVLGNSEGVDTHGGDPLFVVTQVIDPQNFMAKYGSKLIWISNVSTAGVINGQRVRLTNVMKVTGTKTYGTAARSSNTVFVAEPIDTRPADAAMADLLAGGKGRTATTKGAIENAKESRTWTSVDRGFKVEAEFVAAMGEQVRLRKTDGTSISVPIAKLCQEDKEWIDARRK